MIHIFRRSSAPSTAPFRQKIACKMLTLLRILPLTILEVPSALSVTQRTQRSFFFSGNASQSSFGLRTHIHVSKVCAVRQCHYKPLLDRLQVDITFTLRAHPTEYLLETFYLTAAPSLEQHRSIWHHSFTTLTSQTSK